MERSKIVSGRSMRRPSRSEKPLGERLIAFPSRVLGSGPTDQEAVMPTKKSTSASKRRPQAQRRSPTPDAIALLKRDHADVAKLFERWRSLGPGALKSRERVVEKLVRELSIHAAVEEQILYPAVRQLRGGERLADHALEEHQTIEELLAALERAPLDEAEADALVAALEGAVTEHVSEEEGDVFPRLRRESNRAELLDMASLLRAAKKDAPTRPHPNAPSTPPANLVAGAVAGVVDRARDAGRAAVRNITR
jgi:hemerythrin superfamily protein